MLSALCQKRTWQDESFLLVNLVSLLARLALALKEKGLIRYSRGHIVITNRQSLESSACECYHAVRGDRLPVTLGIKL
jgi:hypothetical protein